MNYQVGDVLRIKQGTWMHGGKTGKLTNIRDDHPYIYGVLMDSNGERRWFSVDEIEKS